MTVNTDRIIAASRDYLYLKRRGYSIRSVLNIVGDRFQLNNHERNVLYRGFFTKKEVKGREKKVIQEKRLRGKVLNVDGYNQLITMESYRKGSFVFISTDGIVRDTASIYRSYKLSEITEEVLIKLFKNINSLYLEEIIFYFDEPVSFSGKLCDIVNRFIDEYGLSGRAEAVKSPDYILKNSDLVATSDSIVMEGAGGVFDLAGWLIKRVWKRELLDFRCLMK